MGAVPPSQNIPQPPKGHVIHSCGCRVCATIRRNDPSMAGPSHNGEAEGLAGKNRRAQKQPVGVGFAWGSKQKVVVAQWLALRSLEPDISVVDAAKQLGIPYTNLRSCIYRGSKNGTIQYDDSLSRIEYKVIPMAIDNLEELLADKDKTATLETVKGTIFKEWADRKGVKDTQQTVLALKIEAPSADGEVKAIVGHIVGKPKYIASEEE